ncbi:MAG: glycosyltransferase family 2 protein, partial [Acidobacteria bacterium]|nr:glycosyltransferase family 2 protein [Acidobacteriota bacterium]
MTSLRALGIVFGLIVFLVTFKRFREGRLGRFDFLFGSGLGLAMVLIGAEPNVVNGLRALLSLQDEQFSRLIALAIVSNGLLWLAVLYLRVRWTDLRGQLDRLARGACLMEFHRAYPKVDNLAPVLVLIPAYNEEDNIASVLRRMPDQVCGLPISVLVIDDGSRDQTTKVARETGALAIRSPVNRGGGAALRAGFDIGSFLGSRIAVTMDADGQHDPAEMRGLVQPIVDDRFDFVIGSRLIGQRERDSAVRLAGIYFFNAVIRLLTTATITDCSNGYRALRLETLERIELRQDQYHTSEL